MSKTPSRKWFRTIIFNKLTLINQIIMMIILIKMILTLRLIHNVLQRTQPKTKPLPPNDMKAGLKNINNM